MSERRNVALVVYPNRPEHGAMVSVPHSAIELDTDSGRAILPLRRFAVGDRVFNVWAEDGVSVTAATLALIDAEPAVIRQIEDRTRVDVTGARVPDRGMR